MGLKSLLKPVKWVDEQILRQYTILGKKWEEGGRSIKKLTIPFNIAGICLFIPNSNFIYGFYCGTDFTRNLFEKDQNITSDTITIDNFVLQSYRKLHLFTRLPVFIAGTGMTLKSIFELYDFFINKKNVQLDQTINNLKLGLSFLSISSSIYLKDRNPKLLDKEPFWKKVYNLAKDKISSLAPKPSPQPVPIQSYATLDNYIQAQPK